MERRYELMNKPYDKTKDRLGTEWDDFGYSTFLGEDKELKVVCYHEHKGVVYSYVRYEFEIPEKWERVSFIRTLSEDERRSICETIYGIPKTSLKAKPNNPKDTKSPAKRKSKKPNNTI